MRRGFSQQAVIATLGLVICLVLLFSANNLGTPQPTSGGSYIEGVTAPAGVNGPQNLNPLYATSDADLDIDRLVFSGLTRFDGVNIAPDLAQSWQISSDGKTYTFKLRQNVVWHDGQPFTAADVVFTVNLLKDKRTGANPSLAAQWRDVQASVPTSDTVVLALPQAYAPFLSFTTLAILPAHLLSSYSDNPARLIDAPFNLHPIGTGIYKLGLDKLTPIATPATTNSSLLTLERNAAFYDRARLPLIDRFSFRFYPNTSALRSAFNAGEIDGISYVAPEDGARMEQQATERGDLRTYRSILGRTTFIFLNTRVPALAQRDVRVALSRAIDRGAVVAQALYGQAQVADSPLLPYDVGYGKVEGAYDYDVSAAAQLLDRAGWQLQNGVRTNPAGVELKFTLLYNSDNPYLAQASQIVAADLGKVGVKVLLQPASRDELVNQRLAPRNFDAAMLGWQGLDYDPDAYSLWHSTQADNPDGLNFAGWVSNAADLALEQGRQASKPQQRVAAYYDFQRTFAADMPSIPLYYPYYTYAANQRAQVQRVPYLATPRERLQTVAGWYVQTVLRPPLEIGK